MSKKKSTMTLKDFHGGSIPSDLPLPSAPGVMVRPADRGGFDRQTSWGNSGGRPDQRLRPASAGSARNLDDKSLFLSYSAQIGRNFDEDERKPLDGAFGGPRRTVSDENINAQPSRLLEPKMANISGSKTAAVQVSQLSSDSVGNSYSRKHMEVHIGGSSNQKSNSSLSSGLSYPFVGDNLGKSVMGSNPNAWGLRKETAAVIQPSISAWSAPDAELKLAHASALEKVSSGRWNSKEHVYAKNNYSNIDVGDALKYNDISLAMLAEKSLVVDDVISSGKEIPAYEKMKPATMQMESYEANPSVATGSVDTSFHSASLPSESLGRPKLKLLPRSKPWENIESAVDHKQGQQRQPSFIHLEDNHGIHDRKFSAQPAYIGPVVVEHSQERPKLNLKPRSQHLEPQEVKGGFRRGTIFGIARPREEVLMERGIDDAAINQGQPPTRAKETEAVRHMHVIPHHSEKAENVKYADKRDHLVNGERNGLHARNLLNNRDVEKHHNHQFPLQDRPPSPETWRKPVEQQNPASPGDAPSLRYGKTASAVELAEAFSKSVSDQSHGDRLPGSKGLQRPGQIPFSRLAGPTPRPHVNGY